MWGYWRYFRWLFRFPSFAFISYLRVSHRVFLRVSHRVFLKLSHRVFLRVSYGSSRFLVTRFLGLAFQDLSSNQIFVWRPISTGQTCRNECHIQNIYKLRQYYLKKTGWRRNISAPNVELIQIVEYSYFYISSFLSASFFPSS